VEIVQKLSPSNGPDARADVNAATVLTANSVADNAFLGINNTMQVKDFLKIKYYEIPKNIPRDT
jgi:hypothetical protein